MKKKTNKLFGLFIFAAMLTLLLAQAAFAESAYITTADDFYNAIQNESITDMNITGNITVDAPIEKAVNIDVMSGAELKLGYDEGENGISRFCNANITVEDGGEVVFSHTYSENGSSTATRYLIMNGDFILKSGAEARINKWTTAYGGVVFQGKFENNGTFDCGNGGENGQLFAYVKYDTPLGNVTNGYIVYNLCRTMPSEETIANKAIRITAINGNVKVGETLTAEIDGFGDSSKFPMNSIGWEGNNYTDSGNYHTTYTIVPRDAGKKIGAKFNGIGLISGPTSSRPYDYLVVKDNVVTVIHNGTDKIETETDYVPYLDKVYLGGENSNDTNIGNSPDTAVKSVGTAMGLVTDGGTIVVCGDVQLVNGSFTYITKNVEFVNRDEENTYNASFTDVSGNYSLFYLSKASATVKFTDIKFNNAILLASEYEGCKYIVDNASTNEGGLLGTYIIDGQYANYSAFALDIINCDNIEVSVVNGHENDAPVVTLNNSSITSDGNGNLGDVTLLNNSKLKTCQPMNSLTADNTDNTIELMADDDGNIIPISIEGNITIADSKPIKVVYENAFTEGQTLFNSSKQNDSLTADKFSVSQKGLVLKKLSDSNSIVTAKDENESTSYIMENQGTETGANNTTATYFKITAPITGTITGVNVTGNGETKPFNWENPVNVSGGVEVTLGLIVDGLLDENASAELIVK